MSLLCLFKQGKKQGPIYKQGPMGSILLTVDMSACSCLLVVFVCCNPASKDSM